MISVAEATQRIAGAFSPLDGETVELMNACGRMLVEPITAKLDQPPAPVSSMDGYAVRSAEAGAILKITGTSPAGRPFAGHVGTGEAVRIFTGGVVPDGADSIVIQEDTEASGDAVTIKSASRPGQHIRPAGLDFKKGQTLAATGQRLTARDLSLLAAGDVARVTVRRKPRIAFVATGDELSRPGEARKPGGIVASSGYALAAMIAAWGGDARDLGILPDSEEAIASLPTLAADADIIVTLGGASVGDHDLVQKALGPKGFVLDFWKIAMRPGKPLIFGRLGETPLLGLPGNPVSTLVCARLFLKPAILTMLGTSTDEPALTARLARDLPANDARQDYLRAKIDIRDGERWADPFAVQDSSMLSPLAAADALVIRAPHAPAVAAGDAVAVLLLPE
jgi:molybdopterin molybdotransferase